MEQEFKYMKGTEGNYDYLIVSEKGNIALGIKPIAIEDEMDGGLIAGMRLRVTYKEGASSQESNLIEFPVHKPVGDDFLKAYPNLPYTRIDDVRASVVIGYKIDADSFTSNHSMEDDVLSSWVAKYVEFLVNEIGIEEFIHPEEVYNFLHEGIKNHISSYSEEVSAGYVGLTQEEQEPPAMLKPSKIKHLMQSEGLKTIDGGKTDTPFGLPQKPLK